MLTFDELEPYFAAGPRPAVTARCVTDGCGGVVFAAYRLRGHLVLVVDMEDFRYRLRKTSDTLAGREPTQVRRVEGPHVQGIREPVFYLGLAGVGWPLTTRCREHGAGVLSLGDVASALASPGPPIKVHHRHR